MSYQALARKWRPKTFMSTLGQETTLKILGYALEQQKIHHAYLFTGTRGVGKTSIARLFAKALSCQTGIQTEPCNRCEICQAFESGSFVDFIEIDAASRTKVEDTRELLDHLIYGPQLGRYKIYLIDEIHMLSGHSFNALLKTLEEPPEYVKFLMATTDPQKLPLTVLSRCIQLHLRPLSIDQITQGLQRVLESESCVYEAPAMVRIAQVAQGSMRDALSLLEQALSLGQGQLCLETVESMLGFAPSLLLLDVLEALLKKEPGALLQAVQALLRQVQDPSHLLVEFLECLQDLNHLNLLKVLPKHYQAEELLKLEQFGQQMTPELWMYFVRVAMQGQKEMQYSIDPSMTVEVTFLRMLMEPQKAAAPSIAVVPVAPIPEPPPQSLETQGVEDASLKPLQLNWVEVLPQLDLSYFARDLAMHTALVNQGPQLIEVVVPRSSSPFAQDVYQQEIEQKLSEFLERKIKFLIKIVEDHEFNRLQSAKSEQIKKAMTKKKAFSSKVKQDPFIQALTQDKELGIQMENTDLEI